MRKIYITALFALTGLLLGSCEKDFLDTPPKDKVEASEFFNTATDLEVYTNSFYTMLPTNSLYDAAYGESSDDIVPLIPADRVRGTRTVPVGRGTGGWSWSDLRNINFFLQHYQKANDEEARKKFGGIARFFRAYFYFNKLKMFGPVPLYSTVLEAGDAGLYQPRNSREEVIDFILADINDAVANIPREVQLNKITKYTALMLKARICLYEGTYRKYHKLGGHERFLTEAAAASEELIGYGAYQLFTAGGPNAAYRTLFARDDQTTTETILARDFNPDFGRHNLAYLMTSPTQGAFGITKDVINSYLMQDGSRFTDLPGYATMEFYEEMQNRDPRLTQTTAGPSFMAYGETSPEPVNLSATTTGYRVVKALPVRSQWNSSYNDIILFRYAEALLILAEAKAELGTIVQADLDKTINKLRDRVGMPHLDLSLANAQPDPYLAAMYPNVEQGPNKGLILEIRRERRLELLNEGFRWDDLMRWKEGKKLEKPMLGMYFSRLGAFDFNKDGKADVFVHNGSTAGAPAGITSFLNIKQRPLTNGNSGNLNPFRVNVVFDETRDYFYPLPSEDIILNEQLTQNPNW